MRLLPRSFLHFTFEVEIGLLVVRVSGCCIINVIFKCGNPEYDTRRN